ncbi:cyclic nucleotide-binding domain-containing protein [Streptomyces beihaiensis]|uniref:Replication initiation protein, RepL2 n=1 Tax=Streptomyces beihaiensis TaxID=2984495 RepID=A0ABT3TWD8_9ACTN|nr:replication initiation protein, RepL2 [Streptomyces beihaiensis]MCX3061356.1 replication initiation protein, RepL2 [Streptomyces beihaiensis]
MNNDDKRRLLDVLHRTAGMTANQRLIVMLYAMHPTDRAGAVIETATDLAKLVGMSPTVFSRTRRQVIEAGWLEETERLAHISYYRLSAKSTGEDTVVPLRRAT